MSLERELKSRSGDQCELCTAKENLSQYTLPSSPTEGLLANVYVCSTCKDQIENPDNVDTNHWRCLNDSMWSQEPPVQVLAWRMLSRLKSEGWPQDLLDMMYLEEDTLEWAKADGDGESDEDKIKHIDSNGVQLQSGDSVVLIKDLPVKGSSMIAKRGTAVRRISLDQDNAEYIVGKVDGQTIVIITKYVKKL